MLPQQTSDRNIIQTLVCTLCHRYAQPFEDRTLWGRRFRQQGLRAPEPQGYACPACLSTAAAR